MGTSDERGGPGAAAEASVRAVTEFLSGNRSEIVARWRAAVRRALGPEAVLSQSDPIPELLDRVADLGSVEAEPAVARREALERAGTDEEPAAVVTRLALLREAIMDEWDGPARGRGVALRLLNQAIDSAMVEAVAAGATARQRADRAIERMTAAVSPGHSVDDGASELLRVLVQESSAIDGAALLVHDTGSLVVRAAAGVGAGAALGRSLGCGEGFPGAVAAGHGVVSARWAGDPLGVHAVPEERGPARSVPLAQTLHGVPLHDGPTLLGVLYVASLSAYELSAGDGRLFRVAAGHAARLLGEARQRATADDGTARLARLREGTAARSQALAGFAHDLRSPIGVVLMQAGSLAANGSRDDAQRLLRRAGMLKRAAVRMERLLEDFLAFNDARADDAGALAISAQEPAELVRGAVEAVRPLADEQRVVLEAELSPGLPSLSGDGARLQTALTHLLRSAVQASPQGGRVALRAQHDDVGVVFSVEEATLPLGDDALKDAFDRAWRGERAAPGRSGFGLAVAKAIVEAHGGRVWAATSPTGGNTFCFAVPAARA